MEPEKISTLTEEQEAKLEEYYQKWLVIGYSSTETTNIKKSENAVLRIYKEFVAASLTAYITASLTASKQKYFSKK